jgi:hypothetical protein
MRGYKILSEHCGSQVSLCHANYADSAVVYSKERATVPEPNCGPLAVFATKEDVIKFAERFGWAGRPVWAVEYLPHEGVQGLWRGSPAYADTDVPEGTRYAAAVILRSCLGRLQYKAARSGSPEGTRYGRWCYSIG